MRIIVDMTPLGPGGQNGGAGLVATSLVREFRSLARDAVFVLLTSSDSHAELEDLEAPNVQRRCVRLSRSKRPRTRPNLRSALRRGVDLLPPGLAARARSAAWQLRLGSGDARFIQALNADLLFCPFTAPYFAQPGLPLVAIVHDLQHVAHPAFFTPAQRINREQHLRDLSRLAARVVCVSESARKTLAAEYPLARLCVIRHALLQHFPTQDELVSLAPGLKQRLGRYVLYPANFWPHKNHAALFEALAIYRRQQPSADLRLVCTGAPGEGMAAVRSCAERLLGPEAVYFPGFMPPPEFQALLDNCTGVIYPSLYEGFGLPVLEAMARGKPVACSRIPALRELAGESVVYFDPTNPVEIVRALTSLFNYPAAMLTRARARAAEFGSAEDMAAQYLALFDEVLGGRG